MSQTINDNIKKEIEEEIKYEEKLLNNAQLKPDMEHSIITSIMKEYTDYDNSLIKPYKKLFLLKPNRNIIKDGFIWNISKN